MTQFRQVPDLTRFDKDEAGRSVVWVGDVQATLACETTDSVVVSKSALRDMMRAAYSLGWNGHVNHAAETLHKLAEEIKT